MNPHRVLVADRNPAFLEKTAEILAEAGIGMIPIDNGARVVPLCRHEQPDAAILHVDLPSIPGTEICQRLKTQVDPALPVVLMFSEEHAKLNELVARCAADNFLVRPLKRTELLFCVRSLLQQRRLLQEKSAAGLLVARELGRRCGMVSLDVFSIFLGLELQRVERYGFPLTVLAVGLDPLPEEASAWGKSLETQLGPALADSVRGSLRDIDLTAVLSHRELLALMPHTDAEGGRIAAARICHAVAAKEYNFGRTRIQPSVSVGITCVHGESIGAEELLDRVKAGRSRASAQGGNRVEAV